MSHAVSKTTTDPDQVLRLNNQLCFPLYAATRLMVQSYQPHLDALGLTYPQYLVMLVLWETDAQSVRALAKTLRLDSPTLTEILKKLAKAGLIDRQRLPTDARTVINSLTPRGKKLKIAARRVPAQLVCRFGDRLGDVSSLKVQLETLMDILEARAD